jgi:hypothetical protein
MPFTPFMWLSEVFCFSAQLVCLLKLRRPASLRVLMLILCAGNVLSVLTRGNALLYWDQIWLCRILAVLAFLWAVADVVSLPHKPLPALRLPVLGAIALAVPCWPLRPQNGPAEMEAYRFAGLCLAVFVLVLHLVLSYLSSRRLESLAVRLLACLGAETAVSAATLLYRCPTQWQMLVWWAAIAFLAWGAVKAGDRQDQEATLRLALGARV